VDECQKYRLIATARCHPKDAADNHGVAEGEDGYFNGTTGLPVGIHFADYNGYRIPGWYDDHQMDMVFLDTVVFNFDIMMVLLNIEQMFFDKFF